MSVVAILLTVLALGIIVGGILVLKKSATKFNLTSEQLDKIKSRNEALDKEERKSE